jgi:putative protease
MKVTTYAQTLHDLSLIKENGLEEVILGHKEFSRLGKLTDEDLKKLSTRAQELNLVRIFEWDILMTEQDFSPLAKKLPQYLDQFDEIRLQDPGALEFILTNTDKKIQWITENGNHNLVGLKNWESYIGERLTRLVLSIEIPKAIVSKRESAHLEQHHGTEQFQCHESRWSLGKRRLRHRPVTVCCYIHSF